LTPAALFDLTGKVAVVTGARRGLGQAISLAFAGAGADVIGIGPREMPETAADVGALGRRFASVNADLSRRTTIRRRPLTRLNASAASTFWSTTPASFAATTLWPIRKRIGTRSWRST
jgi:NAD(P)-dependent dehydrogenase (short-subunit alcohol dehydrogenase family)